MPLSEVDQFLLDRCLGKKPFAWESFVDRFLGLIVHVVKITGQRRMVQLSRHDEEDLVAEVFLAIVKDDFAALRRFKGECSLAAYLTVIARRVIVRRLVRHQMINAVDDTQEDIPLSNMLDPGQAAINREEVEALISVLNEQEAEIVRMHYIEDLTYQQISQAKRININSIGPTLSRARAKMHAKKTADQSSG